METLKQYSVISSGKKKSVIISNKFKCYIFELNIKINPTFIGLVIG